MWFKKLKQAVCRHRFDIDDMLASPCVIDKSRITWACYKCGKTYTAHCGLHILARGALGKKPEAKGVEIV